MVQTTPANVNDETQLPALLDAMPAVRGPRGRPRRKPGSIFGDRAYGTAATIALVVMLGLFSFLAPRSDDTHGSGLGLFRYVVERTLAGFSQFPPHRDVLRANGRTLPSLPRPGRLLPGRHAIETLRATVLKQPLRRQRR